MMTTSVNFANNAICLALPVISEDACPAVLIELDLTFYLNVHAQNLLLTVVGRV